MDKLPYFFLCVGLNCFNGSSELSVGDRMLVGGCG